MPFTRVWTKNNPPGSQQAFTADDEIRNLREDIEERIGILVTGWSTSSPLDPLVVRPEVLGNVTGKIVSFSHWSFRPLWSGSIITVGTGETALYLESTGGFTWYAPVQLPIGATITSLSYLFNRNDGNPPNLTGKLSYNDYTTTPATTDIASVTGTANGIQLVTSVLSHVVAANRLYFLSIVLGAGASLNRLYGASIT